MPMAGSYVVPPPTEGTTLNHNGHYSHSPSNSFSGKVFSSPKKASSNSYLNVNGVRKAASSASLFTHEEASNETTPVVSPAHEYQRTLTSEASTHAHDSNGHILPPRLDAHTQPLHQHEHGHSHHSHDQLLAPMKSRPRGESDLSRPAGSYHPQIQASSSWFSLPEALTSLLIPLPYVLASAAYPPSGRLPANSSPTLSASERLLQSTLDNSHVYDGSTERGRGLVEACILTAGTLLLVGILAKMRSSERMLDRRKDKVTATSGFTDVLSTASVQSMVVRTLGVGLPFYASMQIGGLRTGLVLLSSVASGLTNFDTAFQPSRDWRNTFQGRTGSTILILLALISDFSGIGSQATFSQLLFGYLALACSIFFICPPLPDLRCLKPVSQSASVMTPTTPLSARSSWNSSATSPLVSSVLDVNITLTAGVTMFVCTILASGFLGTAPSLSLSAIALSSLSLASAAAAILFAHPTALRSRHKPGVGLSCFLLATLTFLSSPSLWPETIINGALSAAAYVGVLYDSTTVTAHDDHDVHEHAHNAHKHTHTHHSGGKQSIVTKYLIDICEPGSLSHGILSEKDSRRIAYFTCGSLGLLSDTVHMFFDCLGLVVGLGAAVASKWPTSSERPYGWGKLNTLAGFGNGVFLMLVSVEFIWEAFEGIAERRELRHVEELMVVSALGFLVNMVGLLAFGHAHAGHDHGHSHGHDHGHAHSQSNGHALSHSRSHSSGKAPSNSHSHVHSHGQSHGHIHTASIHSHQSSGGSKGDINGYSHEKHEKKVHDHGHDHHNDNMHGIFLHVAADAGGSAAVIISTALTLWKPWYLWDPLATIIIAILIFVAAVPLVISSGQKLLLVVPDELEYKLKNTLQELGELRGVVGYAVPRFWIDDREDAANAHGHDHGHDHGPKPGGTKVQGVIHIISHPAADLEDVKGRVDEFFSERRIDLVIHMEREGDGQCWCGGGQGQ